MPKFEYEGSGRDGTTKKGVIDGVDLSDAESKLRAQGIGVTKLKKAWGNIEIKLPRLSGISTKTLVIFTRQLATMIDAGLPLVQCLEILGAQEPDLDFKRIVLGVRSSVEQGATLADSMKKYPKVFDTLFVSLISAGEVGGILDTILSRLAQYLEKSQKTKQKVQSAMKYPTFVFSAAMGIMAVMLWKVVPGFAGMFKGLGNKPLPALTQFTVNMSNAFVHYLPFIVIASIGIYIGWRFFSKSTVGRRIIDGAMLKMPVIGVLLQKNAIARFTRTLGTLVSSGVPILDGLEVVAKSAGNVVIESAVMYTRMRVAEGKNIAGPLDETKIFPKMVVQMIGVGEATGAMDVMLTKIADFYDDEVDAAVDGLTALIEPLVMIVIGGMVGFVLMSMYLPIFGMADAMSGKQ